MKGRDYDALARDVNLKKITSSKRNKKILRRLRDDDLDILCIGEGHTIGYSEFIVRGGNCKGGDDLGWLGFYIGKCGMLEELHIVDMPGDEAQIDEFLRGLNRNRSLQVLSIEIDLGDTITERLVDFFRHNMRLSQLYLQYFEIGYESAHKLALTLRETCIKTLEFRENEFSKEAFAEIVSAASTQSQIESLAIGSNNVGQFGCTTLGTLLGSRACHLKDLDLRFNRIDDESLRILAAGLTNNATLEKLSLTSNLSITGEGLRSLTPFLQSESCSLKVLFFYNNHIGDAGAAAFAHGLAKNKSLMQLWFDPSNCGITSTGWQSFVTLLCDTSSVNNTYLSNHTLELIGESCDKGPPTDHVYDHVRSLLRMRKFASSREAAMSKIFQSHPDLDMEPLFVWGLRVLPLVFTWFEKVRSYRVLCGSVLELELRRRELSAVYQFVRGMPLLVVEGFTKGITSFVTQRPCRRCGRKRKFIDA
jgi:hypothetical protein